MPCEVKNDDGAVAELIYRLADKSLELEQSRYDSLMGQSSRLLTAFSILSVAEITAGVALLGQVGNKFPDILVLLTLMMICMMAGFAATVVSQFRKPYQSLPSPEEIRKHIDNNSQADTNENAARQYAASLNKVYETMRSRNDFILAANRVATGSLLAALACAAVLLVSCLVVVL